MTADEIQFVDTNVLLTATDISRDGHRQALRLLALPGNPLAISGQVLREYLAVATRPVSVNGLGMKPHEACRNCQQFRKRAILLEETEKVSILLHRLVRDYSLRGEKVHDANIAATMMTHGLSHIITLNPGDFEIFKELSAVAL